MNRVVATRVAVILLATISLGGDAMWRAASLERSWRPVGEPWEEWVNIRPPALATYGNGAVVNHGELVAWGWQGSAWFRDGKELVSEPRTSPPKSLQSLLDDLVPTSRKFGHFVSFNSSWNSPDSTFDPPKSAGIAKDRYTATPCLRLHYSVQQETGVATDLLGRRTVLTRWHARKDRPGTWVMDFKQTM